MTGSSAPSRPAPGVFGDPPPGRGRAVAPASGAPGRARPAPAGRPPGQPRRRHEPPGLPRVDVLRLDVVDRAPGARSTTCSLSADGPRRGPRVARPHAIVLGRRAGIDVRDPGLAMAAACEAVASAPNATAPPTADRAGGTRARRSPRRALLFVRPGSRRARDRRPRRSPRCRPRSRASGTRWSPRRSSAAAEPDGRRADPVGARRACATACPPGSVAVVPGRVPGAGPRARRPRPVRPGRARSARRADAGRAATLNLHEATSSEQSPLVSESLRDDPVAPPRGS